MANLHSRVKTLEKQHGESVPFVVRVYYHDRELGYSEKAGGPYFDTFEALAEAQGWAIRESDVNIAVTYASQDAIFLPDNGREDIN